MKVFKIALGIGIIGLCAMPVMAGPHHGRHHHHGNDGVRLAANIIGLVGAALQGPQTAVTQPAVVVTPPPVVHCPPPPRVVHYRPAPPPRRHHHPAPPRHHRR